MKFILQPFPTTQPLPDVQITGNITRNQNKLNLNYALNGNIAEVDIPSSSDTPTRKNELWQDTCFEFFIGIKNTPDYWEFNLSPSGDWNIYRFTGYRQEMVEETAFTEMLFSVERRLDSLVVSLNVNLAKIVLPEAAIEVAITTVIKDKNSQVSYWALTHRGATADFHLRESFVVQL